MIRTRLAAVGLVGVCVAGLVGCPNVPPNGGNNAGNQETIFARDMVVLGYNDLGMHCMNQDFSEFMILPPFNTVHAQVIRRGEEPQIVTSGVTVSYALQGNTRSADKTNFWTYAKALLNVDPQADVGLAGKGLSGTMDSTSRNDWVATGIPVTPIDDQGNLNAYPLALIQVDQNGTTVASTQAVVPVSWEISCDLCHTTPGISVATDILRKHDQLHPEVNPPLEQRKPVACGSCHAQAPLAGLLSGDPNLPNLSQAMHHAHSSRMGDVVGQTGGSVCYACHPGIQTKCLRDVHFSHGLSCETCHTSMAAVADPARQPWVDEPRCSDCHNRPGFQFEQAGTLYRDSKGHHGVHCEACHGSPHAITPTVVEADNLQTIGLQGHAGKINTCSVCHGGQPDDSFEHALSDGHGD